MITTTHPAARIIASLLALHGVKDVILSPGSRNTPLTVAINATEDLNTISVVDERSAAFMALGISVRKDRPVALVCTSGSAVLNYSPAIAEAFYRQVPLIVISADRPSRWIDMQDGQTVRQFGALENFVKKSFALPDFHSNEEYLWNVNTIVNEAILTALSDCPGPVHINVPFDIPLGETENYQISVFDIRKFNLISPRKILSLAEVKSMVKEVSCAKIAIIIGSHKPDARLNKAVKKLSACKNVIVFCEAESNIKALGKVFGCISNPEVVTSLIPSYNNERYFPDLIINLGGNIVSKNLKSWLRNLPLDIPIWNVGRVLENIAIDTYQHLSSVIDVDVPAFLSTLASVFQRNTSSEKESFDFKNIWIELQQLANEKTKEYISTQHWCDLKAVCSFFDYISPNVDLQLSNGMSIRYAQLADYNKVHRIDCNRGCNGIDGSTSTAVGAALVSNRPTVLLTGDTSLRYDIGVLASGILPANFSIFVLNNNGGDIFRIISPTRNQDCLEKLIATPHNLNFERMALAFGFDYIKVRNCDTLRKACLRAGQNAANPLLVEIDTSDVDNAAVYRNLFKQIKK